MLRLYSTNIRGVFRTHLNICNGVFCKKLAFEIFKIDFFFMISPQDPHWGSLEKANQPPGRDHPFNTRTKMSLAILKILICSTDLV